MQMVSLWVNQVLIGISVFLPLARSAQLHLCEDLYSHFTKDTFFSTLTYYNLELVGLSKQTF